MKTMDALDMMEAGSKGAPSKGGDEAMGMVGDARDMLAKASGMMSGKKAESLQHCIDMLDAEVLEAPMKGASGMMGGMA